MRRLWINLPAYLTLIGLVSFWTMQIWGIIAIYDYTSQFFTGALVPLWFFPAWLRQVADLLPFQAQAFIPLAIYTGQIPEHEIPTALVVRTLRFRKIRMRG
jgi:ABC-2 type transport system permease protein